MREMKTVGKDASLHEKAIQKVAEGEPKIRVSRKVGEVAEAPQVRELRQLTPQSVKSHPMAGPVAVELAHGDYARIQVLDTDDLVVHNNAGWRRGA